MHPSPSPSLRTISLLHGRACVAPSTPTSSPSHTPLPLPQSSGHAHAHGPASTFTDGATPHQTNPHHHHQAPHQQQHRLPARALRKALLKLVHGIRASRHHQNQHHPSGRNMNACFMSIPVPPFSVSIVLLMLSLVFALSTVFQRASVVGSSSGLGLGLGLGVGLDSDDNAPVTDSNVVKITGQALMNPLSGSNLSIAHQQDVENSPDIVLIRPGPRELCAAICRYLNLNTNSEYMPGRRFKCLRGSAADTLTRNEVLRPFPRRLVVCDSMLPRNFHPLASVVVVAIACPYSAATATLMTMTPWLGAQREEGLPGQEADLPYYVDLPISAPHPAMSHVVLSTIFPYLKYTDSSTGLKLNSKACATWANVSANNDDLNHDVSRSGAHNQKDDNQVKEIHKDKLLVTKYHANKIYHALLSRMLHVVGYSTLVSGANISVEQMMDAAEKLEVTKTAQKQMQEKNDYAGKENSGGAKAQDSSSDGDTNSDMDASNLFEKDQGFWTLDGKGKVVIGASLKAQRKR